MNSFTRTVRKIAKNVKNVASQMKRGLSKVASAAKGIFGKNGPIGKLALDLVFPGEGESMFGNLWKTATKEGDVLLDKFRKGFNNAYASVASAGGSISNKVENAAKFIGNKIEDSFESLWKGAEATDTTKVERNNMGNVVVQKAQDINKDINGKFIVDDSVFDATNKRGISESIGQVQAPLNMSKQPLPVQLAAAEAQGIDKATVDAARLTQISPFSEQAKVVADKGIVPSGVGFDHTPDLLEVGKKLAGGFLSNVATAPGGINTPFVAGGATPAQGVGGRGGVGGTGASGGDFLSQQQQAFFQGQRQNIEALG